MVLGATIPPLINVDRGSLNPLTKGVEREFCQNAKNIMIYLGMIIAARGHDVRLSSF